MAAIKTKEDLLVYMKEVGACGEAHDWVKLQQGTAREIWCACHRMDWLLWLGGIRNPQAAVEFAMRCAARAETWPGHWPSFWAHSARLAAERANAAASRCSAAVGEHATTAAYYAADAAAATGYSDQTLRALAWDAERALQLKELHAMW